MEKVFEYENLIAEKKSGLDELDKEKAESVGRASTVTTRPFSKLCRSAPSDFFQTQV